jgi:hypothetical protein
VTLPCIREFLTKYPNIYITTEWDDKDLDINTTSFDINNDLYLNAIVLWFIPIDSNNVESLRVYPNHMIDHEMPVIPGLKLVNEQNQGNLLYSWDIMNKLIPAQLKLSPLLENMGMISFTPVLRSNKLPLAYYDTNLAGYLKGEIKSGEGRSDLGQAINLKQGKLKIISIGINGVANVNLNMFRLIF